MDEKKTKKVNKMAQTVIHPIEAIASATAASLYTIKPIKSGMCPSDFEDVLEELNEKLENFVHLTDKSIKANQLENDPKCKSMQDRARRTIIKSACDKDFCETYHDDIKYYKNADNLLNFIKEIIGEVSLEQKQEKASKKLRGSTRNITREEKFSRFLATLTRIAEGITDNTHTRGHLVNEEFKKNLTRENRAYLKDHGKNGKSVKEIAQFLDEKEKYKKTVSINAVDTAETTIEIKALREQIHAQSQQIQNLTLLWQNKTHEIDERLDANEELIDVNKLAARQNYPKTRAVTPTRYENRTLANRNEIRNKPIASQQHQQSTINQYPADWELNRYGAPYRCRKCGIRGHRDFNCKGTDKSCDECGQSGHIKPACPKRPTTQYGQRPTTQYGQRPTYQSRSSLN